MSSSASWRRRTTPGNRAIERVRAMGTRSQGVEQRHVFNNSFECVRDDRQQPGAPFAPHAGPCAFAVRGEGAANRTLDLFRRRASLPEERFAGIRIAYGVRQC